jgi:hypothetical protein
MKMSGVESAAQISNSTTQSRNEFGKRTSAARKIIGSGHSGNGVQERQVELRVQHLQCPGQILNPRRPLPDRRQADRRERRERETETERKREREREKEVPLA